MIFKLIEIGQIPGLVHQSKTLPSEKDYYETHKARYQYTLDEISKVLEDGKLKILDYGCGYMHLSISLKSSSSRYQVTAYDVNDVRMKERVDFFGIQYCSGEIGQKMPFEENAFDVIVLSEVLEHLTLETKFVFTELTRVLKRTGILIITTPNKNSYKNIIQWIYHREYKPFLSDILSEIPQKTHWKEYTQKELFQLLTHFNLKISSMKPFDPHPNKLIIRKLLNLIPSIRQTFFIIARK